MGSYKIWKIYKETWPIRSFSGSFSLNLVGLPNRHDEVEEHVEFLMEYFASFGTTMVPNMGIHKKILTLLANRYNLFDKKQQIKDLGFF